MGAYGGQLKPKFFNGQRWAPTVKHGMTVRTNGPQVRDRIKLVILANLTERAQVMHMNEAAPKLTEVEALKRALHQAVQPILVLTRLQAPCSAICGRRAADARL